MHRAKVVDAVFDEGGGDERRRALLATISKELTSTEGPETPHQEHRRSPRLAVPLRVHCRLNEHRTVIAFPLNVSAGGLFLPLSIIVEPREFLDLSLFPADYPAKICCEGRIAWVNRPELCEEPLLPPGVGLQWVDLSTEGQALICDLLAAGRAPS